MAEANGRKHKLILIASAQNWPNVDSVIHYKGKDQGLSEVRIFATDTMKGSAEALAAAVKYLCGNDVNVEIDEVGGEPFDAMRGYLNKRISDGPWILNATGGLKPFSFEAMATLCTAGESPWLTVIYKEIGGSEKYGNWVQVLPGGYKGLEIKDVSNDRASLPIEMQLKLSLKDASVTVQERLPRDGAEIPGPEPTPKHLWDLLEIVSRVNTWEERLVQLIKKYPQLQLQKRTSEVFEFLVFQTACYVGLNSPHWGVKASRANEDNFEFDVCAWVGDTFYVFDCKLYNKIGEKVNYVQAAADKAERAGGIKYAVIFLWPNVTGLTDEIYALAKARKCEIWGPPEMRGKSGPAFFGRMAKLSMTEDDSVSEESELLDNQLRSLSGAYGSDVCGSRAVYDFRDSFKKARVAVVRHDNDTYTVTLRRKSPDSTGVDGVQWQRRDAKLLDLDRPKYPYCHLWKENSPRALIFPWGVELRWPKDRFAECQPDTFHAVYQSNTVICRADLSEAEKWAQGSDLVQALENLLNECTKTE